MLDALLVVARLPRGVCVMKAELMRNIFLGGGARLARYIRNDVGRGMVRDAVASLREGGQLVLFPEGTRTVGAPINPFKPGITLIAQLAQVPIQTVIIETDSPYLAQGLAAAEGAAGAGRDPRAPRPALRARRPTIARCCARLERYFAEELRPVTDAPASATHVVVIPSYDTGPIVYETVRAARAAWSPVWVVVDGSSDGTAEGLRAMAAADPGLRVDVLPRNSRQGRRGAARARSGARGRLHPRADDGLRRPASGRPDPDLHGARRRRSPTR